LTEGSAQPQAETLDPDRVRQARIRTAQVAATCLAGAAHQRDPLTGDALPRSLSEVLGSVRRNSAVGRHPLPADGLQELVEFVLGPLAEVIERPRARIKRSHEMMPLHRVRELDAKCMEWVGRQSGRTIREKLAGKPAVLGVRRDFSPETNENILVAKLLHGLLPRLDERLRALGGGEYEVPDEPALARAETLRECERVCLRALRKTGFGEIDHRRPVRPNNVLLGDRRYLKLWRGWRWLRALDAGEDGRAEVAAQLFMQALFLRTAARAAEYSGSGRAEELVRIPTSSANDVTLHQVQRYALAENGRFCKAALGSIEFLCAASGKRPKSFLLLELVGETIVVTLREATGQGLLFAGSTIQQWTHRFDFAPAIAERGRELAVQCSSWPEWTRELRADLEGIRSIADAIVAAALGAISGAPMTPAVSKPLQAARRRCGIDIGYATPVAWVDGCAAIPSLPGFAVGLSLEQEGGGDGQLEWMTCGRGFAVDACAEGTDFACIRDAVERGEELTAEARAGLTKALSQLGDELELAHGLGADVVKPVAIPDSVDELSQKALRSVLAASFGRIMPFWRSSCLVLAWQQQASFGLAKVSDGDGLIVIDICSEQLAVALFGAKHDASLAARAPLSKGIHWQRRPAICARDLDPRTADAVRGVSWRDAMLSFARRRLPTTAFGGRLSEDEAERFRASLVDAGYAERVFLDGGSIAVPLIGAGAGCAVELTHDPRDVASVADQFQRDLARALKSILRQELVKAYMNDIQLDRKRWHVLLAGVPGLEPASTGPFRAADAPRSALLGAEVWLGYRAQNIVSIGMSQALAAMGSAEMLQRRNEGQLSVANWLPSLWLEVVRDGGFHQFTLLKEQAVGSASFDAVQRFPVEESLRIPAGESTVRFPLFEGRAMRRDREVCITSPQFPLQKPLEVSATIEYRAGEAQPYRLVFMPLEPSIRVQISADIVKPIRPRGLSPSFPPARGWDDDKVVDCIERARAQGPWIARKLDRLKASGGQLDVDTARAEFVPDLRKLCGLVRTLWGDGRVLTDAPRSVQSQIEDALPFDWIERLSACDQQSQEKLRARVPDDKARNLLRRWGRRILACMHRECREALLSAVLSEHALHPLAEHIEVFGRLVGDGEGRGAECMERLVAAVRAALESAGAQASSSAILALADACWRDAGFVSALHAAAPDLVDLYLERARSLVKFYRVSAIASPDKAFFSLAPQCVRAIGETALAFMRLRNSARPPATCEAGSPLLIALSIEFCESERLLAAVTPPPQHGAPPRKSGSLRLPSYLQFDYARNAALNQTSDLAFVLRHYLNGGSGAMIEIVGWSEDDDGG